MLRWTGTLVWLVALAGCNCDWKAAQLPNRAEPRAFEGRGFSATIRADVRHSADTPEQGVTLYDFHVGSMPLLFVYAGDNAGYPHFNWPGAGEEKQALPSGLTARCRSAEHKDGKARECLIALSKQSPQQLLVFYEKLSDQWAGVADAIVESIKPRP
jgi:hypothetical protein